MDTTFKAMHLLAEELDYELRIRGVVTKKPAEGNRKILQRSIDKDYLRPADYFLTLNDPKYSHTSEPEAITSTIVSIKELLSDFEGTTSDSLFKRLKTRITHITFRILRFKVPDEEAEVATDFKNETYASCLGLEAELFERVVDESSQSPPITPTVTHPLVLPPPISEPKSIPIYKWGVTFSGESSGMSVYQFLERVEELAKARHASKVDLYASAIALFEDKALLWFRSVRSRISDWDALITALKQEFLPPDYDDILWDEMKVRVQSKSETITIFVAVMETLFSRLTRPQ